MKGGGRRGLGGGRAKEEGEVRGTNRYCVFNLTHSSMGMTHIFRRRRCFFTHSRKTVYNLVFVVDALP